MTFIKDIQGLGSKGADTYYTGTPPNVAVFNGNTYYIIGDGGNPYNPLPIATPRTYICVYKITTQAFASFMYNTFEFGGNYQGEYLTTFLNGTTRIGIKSTDAAQTYNQSNLKTGNNKWHSMVGYYDGSGDVSNTPQYNNGKRSALAGIATVSGIINSNGLGHIGKDPAVLSNDFYGNIAILSIYKGLFTHTQNTEIATDPFGFMARLRAIPTEKAKLYLDIDFNKTGAALPTDEGEGNGGVGFPITLGGGTASYTPFA